MIPYTECSCCREAAPLRAAKYQTDHGAAFLDPNSRLWMILLAMTRCQLYCAADQAELWKQAVRILQSSCFKTLLFPGEVTALRSSRSRERWDCGRSGVEQLVLVGRTAAERRGVGALAFFQGYLIVVVPKIVEQPS